MDTSKKTTEEMGRACASKARRACSFSTLKPITATCTFFHLLKFQHWGPKPRRASGPLQQVVRSPLHFQIQANPFVSLKTLDK